MSLGRLLRRASSKASDLLTLAPGGSSSPSALDGEILYSKNNVCVHPPALLPAVGEHHPGDGVSQTPRAPFLSAGVAVWIRFYSLGSKE